MEEGGVGLISNMPHLNNTSIRFLSDISSHCRDIAVLISGKDSLVLRGKEYVQWTLEGRSYYGVICFESHSSPRKEALISNSCIAVGHEEHFYLYDFLINELILRIKLNGYFDHLYKDGDLLFVTGAQDIYCIDLNCKQVRWITENLGIDGVIIESITETKIFGAGEWDPPNGWRDFELNKLSGAVKWLDK